MERLFRSFLLSDGKRFDVSSPDVLAVAVDAQDLREMLGYLLDSAFKRCGGRVCLDAVVDPGEVLITIEDDGPGIDAASGGAALAHGRRQNTSVPGTELGLSITLDLAEAYGGRLGHSGCVPAARPGATTQGRSADDPATSGMTRRTGVRSGDLAPRCV